jgi:20S proteasome subunit beta 2
MVSSQLELHRYATGRESRVVTALTMLKSHLFGYQGAVSAALVLGGVDVTGPHLHAVYPHGSTDTLPFATMGSGSLAAMAMFESRFKEGMTREEGIEVVCAAICAGIFNDLGSGSNVDLCVITKVKKNDLIHLKLINLFYAITVAAASIYVGSLFCCCLCATLQFHFYPPDDLQGGKEYLRNYQQPNPRSYTHSKGYHFTSGHTGLHLSLSLSCILFLGTNHTLVTLVRILHMDMLVSAKM